jgi:hypothetical protein
MSAAVGVDDAVRVDVRCVACGDRWTPVEDERRRCRCGRSLALRSDDAIELQGPIEAVSSHEGRTVVTAGVNARDWPSGAPRVGRRRLPPLL